MVGSQADFVAEVVAGLNRKRLRENYSSGSDDEVAVGTNRGNKLKRSAKYVQEGNINAPEGRIQHPQKIVHANFTRSIVYRNPKRYDEDGVELSDNDSDEHGEAITEENPYSNVHIERILEPLMRASDLPSNPSFSIPYTSAALTNMVKEAERQLQAARTALAKAKNILTEFRGDENWAPGALMESEDDFDLFLPRPVRPDAQSHPGSDLRLLNGSRKESDQKNMLKTENQNHSRQSLEDQVSKDATNGQAEPMDVEMVDAPTNVKTRTNVSTQNLKEGVDKTSQASKDKRDSDKGIETLSPEDAGPSERPNGVDSTENASKDPAKDNNKQPPKNADKGRAASTAGDGSQANLSEDEAEPAPPRRMTTRAQAQAASNSTSASSTSHTRAHSPAASSTISSNYISPLYLIPETSMPDRDFGLPPSEADETRRLLVTYIQKQEEVVRGHERIFQGLSRANRYRTMVYEWCKAEGHTGEMSDGEDWYDKDYWALDGDLRKGVHDEDEVEAAVSGEKGKRRGRK